VGKESVESEKNRFTIIVKGKKKSNWRSTSILYSARSCDRGYGQDRSGARVMVNGKEVPIVGDDGTFHYFTPPLANGRA